MQPPPSTRTQNHILQTNSHFTPELLICAAGDLTMNNLAYSPRWFDSHRPTLVVSKKISFISLYFFWGWMFVCVRLLTFILCYNMNTSCFPHLSEFSSTEFIFPLSAQRFSDSKNSGAIPSSLSLKVPWMGAYSEIYGGWLRTAGNWGLAIALLD